uniref:Uncharacterized protein n=1 Tax=Lotharella oceanica TaxID=641309 RepID=A0A7S2TS66_9EUKA
MEDPAEDDTRVKSSPDHLLRAIAENKVDDFQAIVDAKADVNARSKMAGVTALEMVAKSGSAEMCEILLEAKANPRTRDRQKRTPLLQATILGNAGVVTVLLGSGVGEERDINDDTALHLAAQRGKGKLVFLLGAQLGLYLDAANAKGQSPLHCALGNTPVNHDTVAALLYFKYRKLGEQRGGTVDLGMMMTDTHGQTVLHYAASTLLNEPGDTSLLAQILELSYLEDIRSVSATDDDGRTPLHIAALHDRYSFVQYLTKFVGDHAKGQKQTVVGGALPTWVNNGDTKGLTALHLAAISGSLQTLRLLVAIPGADVNVGRDTSGWPPIMHAAKNGHLGVIRALLAARASLTPVDLNHLGSTQNEVDVALGSGHVEVARALLQMQHSETTLAARLTTLRERVGRVEHGKASARGSCAACSMM